MNEFTPDDMRFACDLMLGLCAFLGLLIVGVTTALIIEFGTPAIDQVVSVLRPIFHLIGG